MQLRRDNLNRLKIQNFDVLILGGGINGAVSAASLSAKGARVALIDRGDFAGLASSNSSNLAWGGIKYLENHDYALVNKLCSSRNHLMRSFPSSVKEIRFLTTIERGFRYAPFVVFLGAWIYWILGRCMTKPPRYLRAAQITQVEPVINHRDASGGVEYSDCYFPDNDARFVFGFIRASMKAGGVAANYVESIKATRQGNYWVVNARDNIAGECFKIRANVLINACGSHVDEHNQQARQATTHRHLFSKGVHLIVDKVTNNAHVMAFFASDGRLFFVLPMGAKTCIGTTDTSVQDPEVSVTEADRQFVLDNANRLLNPPRPLTNADIIAERCGVRPLVSQGAEDAVEWLSLSRKHVIEVNHNDQHLSIFGGKLTDCINVGDEVAERVSALGVHLSCAGARWYGEAPESVKRTFFSQAAAMNLDARTPDGFSEPLSARLWRRYGADAITLLASIEENPRQGQPLMENAEYLRCELEHAACYEMVTKLDDFLARRSKIALVLRREDIINARGFREVCDILFADAAQSKLREYVDGPLSTHSLEE